MTPDFWIGAASGAGLGGMVLGTVGYVIGRFHQAAVVAGAAQVKEAAAVKEAVAARDAITTQLAKDVRETAAMPADKVLDALNDDFSGFARDSVRLSGPASGDPTAAGSKPGEPTK